MIEPGSIRSAVVVNTRDPKREGRIQVRVLPELYAAEERNLPWASPEVPGVGVGSQSGVHITPALGTFVKVVIEDKFLQDLRWIGADHIPGRDAHANFIHELSIPELTPQVYPQPNLIRYPDGTIIFHNIETGELGVQRAGDTYFLMTTDGRIVAKSGDSRFEIADGKITLDAKKIDLKNLESLDEDFSTQKMKYRHMEEEGVSKNVQIQKLTQEILGLSQLKYGGDLSVAVAGNKAEATLGNSEEMVTGDRNDLVGGDYTITVANPVKRLTLQAGPSKVEIDPITGITITGVGTMQWVPNALPACLFTGVPHGGIGMGIVGLKGGIAGL